MGKRIAQCSTSRRQSIPLDDDDAYIVGRSGEINGIGLDGFENFLRREMFYGAHGFLQLVREVGAGFSRVLQQAVGVEQQDVPSAHETPFVQPILLLETEHALSRSPVDDIA